MSAGVRLDAGVMAEFATPDALLGAARALRKAGYEALEAFTPHQVEGLAEAIGLDRPKRMPLIVLIGALTGAAVGYGIQWLTVVLYPLDVGGRPPHAVPAFMLITFETAVLFGAFAAFFGLFGLLGLPRLWHRVFEVDGFESATVDRYWLAIDAADPRFDYARSSTDLEAMSPLRVVRVGGRA